MFTGIITDIGTIRSAEHRDDTRIVIGCGFDSAHLDIGASIACSGCCLTVVARGSDGEGHWFAVDASAETIARTARGMWAAGRRLNLERALKVGDELGGHIVTGHVDGTGAVIGLREEGGSHRILVEIGQSLAPYIAAKGSITIDGVSLTVNEVSDQADGCAQFAVNIIPHSWAVTTLGAIEVGGAVNIEIDILARYLARMRETVAI
jgi:riboflavin synthase